jgi:Ni/Co efflux regulator RcnB
MWVAASAAMILAIGSAAAQDRGQRNDQNRQSAHLDEHDQQVARDWYSQHQDHPPAGLRSQDRLSPEQESRLHEGAVLDKDLRKKAHPAPRELSQRLAPPPPDHRYVAIGGHISLIDKDYNVKAVVHLHDNH